MTSPDPTDRSQPDQRPDTAPRTPTGAPTRDDAAAYAQHGPFLTTSGGTRLTDTDHSLKAGRRGPTLLQDHHFREKITHFDHERVPERVVHARGAGAHGYFESYGNAASFTRAGFLAPNRRTPVFVRFSTVLGSRGSADTVRDTRGFAVKFYTDEGTFDLVGNNMPVFFIQDAIKFPDIIHAGKPHPDREIPQAQSAHDTFWDFVSLHTEAQHLTMWNMSDRGIPRSYRMMEGFGLHTFRTVAESGRTFLVKFHWKPVLGVHSLIWEEAQLTGGADPDFHRRDLAEAIEAGSYPQWELGVQVMPDDPEQQFHGIDLLDPTKLVPEELAPVQPIGRMTLDRNPGNYFEETEQVAFHPGHLVPGIDVTADPLLQGRLFSYLDTQLTRLGGPNFDQLPINRPHAPVDDMFRDGFGQQAGHTGIAPYHPNSLDGGAPHPATRATGGFIDVPVSVEGQAVREAPQSFEDHFTQPRMFWLSMTPLEQDHIIGAYAFELAKCGSAQIRARQLACLARIDERLCREVAEALGLPVPDPQEPLADPQPSPALSQLHGSWPVDARVVGVVVDPQHAPQDLEQVRSQITDAGMTPHVIAPSGAPVEGVAVDETLAAARSVEFDALVLLGGPAPAGPGAPRRDAKAGAGPADGLDLRVRLLVEECWRHGKPLLARDGGLRALAETGLDTEQPGVREVSDAAAVVRSLQDLLAHHRVWERFETGA